ncbi:hypothetical protein CC80DRAFT_437292 [Byssothecium circinans]|uniref:Uncharacterized protein n=1 Tax=Byssothecium circinans TaxID=147558 RepID=A0A6A5UC04_9PLEO|nr:hypothetical protein CC80DRAFT_437292 [Byssothecium circinans]
MEAQHIDANEGLDDAPPRSVHIVTNEDMIAFREQQRLNPATGPDVFISPLSDESVQGYPNDRIPQHNGASEIRDVVRIPEGAGVPCCMVAEPALIYYGTGRVMVEWIMCVPTDQLEAAAQIFRANPIDFEPFRPSALSRPQGIEHLFPRFKSKGLQLFFILMSAQACHIPCRPENIEYSLMGLPYPKLSIYAQSLLDTRNFVDLEDLIDGMNLTLDWGVENLDLEGTIDADWGRWRANLLIGGQATEDQDPGWCAIPPKRLDAWMERVSNEAKKIRQGHKYLPNYETRFWKRGQKDPRLRKREYC